MWHTRFYNIKARDVIILKGITDKIIASIMHLLSFRVCENVSKTAHNYLFHVSPRPMRCGTDEWIYMKFQTGDFEAKFVSTLIFWLKSDRNNARRRGLRGDVFGWGTALSRKVAFHFPIVSLEYFIDIILPTVLWSWDRFSLNRNKYQ